MGSLNFLHSKTVTVSTRSQVAGCAPRDAVPEGLSGTGQLRRFLSRMFESAMRKMLMALEGLGGNGLSMYAFIFEA